MSIATKHSAGLCEVSIEGEISLPGINEVREALMAAMGTANSVRLDVRGLSGADLSCLQLFCAVHKSAMKKGKEVTLSPQASSLLRETMERAGYSRDAGCRTNSKCLLGGASRE